METDQLAILQNAELRIIKEFHKICEENNLRYVLAFGTLIGCVRHKGFIPWDDDIDVVMPYEDFIKFNEIANQVADERYTVFNSNTVARYAYPFSKLVIKKSSAIFEYPFKYFHDQPIYVDIFPAFFVPEQKLRFRRVQISNFFRSQTGRMKTLGPFKQTKRGIFAKAGFLFFFIANKCVSQKRCYTKMLKIASSVKREEAKSYYIGDMYSQTNSISRFQLPLDVFETRVLMKFEDIELYMPKDYDSILRTMYGDYMQLPPEEKRKSHGFIFVSDSLSYQEYDQQMRENSGR